MSQIKEPRFSVIVPVFNSQKYLKKCLDSVANQSFRNYEVILVDDGSTDKSGAICDGYAERYDNIKVIHKQNQGQIAARLDGVKNATGEYIVFADSDDTLKLKALEILNKKIEQYKPDGVIYELSRMSAHGLIKIPSGSKFKEYILTDKGALYREILSTPSHCSVCKKAFKRELFTTSGFEKLFDMRIGEDFFQTMDLITNANSVLFIPDDLYNYRNNPGSAIHSERTAERFKTDFTSARYVLDLVQNSPYFNEDDLKEQLTLSMHGITDRLEEISNLKASYERKKELFEQIKTDQYFIDYILGLGTADLVGFKKRMYSFFLESKYKQLIWREKLVHLPKRIKYIISIIL